MRASNEVRLVLLKIESDNYQNILFWFTDKNMNFIMNKTTEKTCKFINNLKMKLLLLYQIEFSKKQSND